MIKCPKCSHENADAIQICEVCGELLIKPTFQTKKYDDADYEQGTPRWGSARVSSSMSLVLDVVDTKRSFVYEMESINRILMGRKDAEETEFPLIDLGQVGGLEKGVSRRHAEIIRRDGALHIMDNGSSNGTYLNGQKLVAQQPRVLRDGDEIRLGHLAVRVTFRAVQSN